MSHGAVICTMPKHILGILSMSTSREVLCWIQLSGYYMMKHKPCLANDIKRSPCRLWSGRAKVGEHIR